MTALAVTKLDVLTGLGPLRVCTRLPRRRGGALHRLSRTTRPSCTRPPASTRSCRAGTRTSPRCRDEADLPQAARDYLAFVADFIGVPIALIGVGAARDQVIWTEAGRETSAGRRVALA